MKTCAWLRRGGVLLLSFALLALPACGDERAAVPPAARDAPASAEGGEPATGSEAGPRPTLPQVTAPTPEQVDRALRDLASQDAARRRAACVLLLDGAHGYKEVAQLALRAARLDRDVGLLADLLSDHPASVLPHVLHRVTHAAAIQRGRICRALGRSRKDTRAAQAVLYVRALLDPERQVRSEARAALVQVEAAARDVLAAHALLHPRTADGSMARISPGLLLGTGNLGAPTPFRQALLQALEADAQRFGASTAVAVEAFRAELEGERVAPTSPDRIRPAAWGAADLDYGAYLARTYTGNRGHLRELLERPGWLRPVAFAYGELGAQARADAPVLLAAWRRHLQGLPPQRGAQRASATTLPRRSASPPAWDEVSPAGASAALAWALAQVGNRTDDVLAGLWELLALDLPAYDRELVELALCFLRPRGTLVERILQAHASSPRSATPAALRASASRVLPWVAPGALADVEARVRAALAERRPRPERMWLRRALRGIEEAAALTGAQAAARRALLAGRLVRHAQDY